jgi:hypothetical protein
MAVKADQGPLEGTGAKRKLANNPDAFAMVRKSHGALEN